VPSIKNLDEYVTWLKSLRRPINVGIFQGNTRTVAQYLSNTYGIEINVVMFTNGTQMYPSLSDGSLDLAFDTGGAVSVAEQGRFKIVGYTSTGQISRLKSFPNFANGNQELAGIESWFGIAVPKNTDKTYKDLLIKRIGFLIQQEKFRSAAESAVSSVDGLSGQRLQDLIAYQKSVVRRHWK
jgi:tripartite-type tricarboxylate transporter receptor subunit TctC